MVRHSSRVLRLWTGLKNTRHRYGCGLWLWPRTTSLIPFMSRGRLGSLGSLGLLGPPSIFCLMTLGITRSLWDSRTLLTWWIRALPLHAVELLLRCRDCPKGIDFSSAVHCDICEHKKKQEKVHACSCNSLLCICFSGFSTQTYFLHVARIKLVECLSTWTLNVVQEWHSQGAQRT